MITETSAVAFRQNLGEMLNIVQYRNDSVLIKKDGKPVAALIDAKLFLRIRQMQERFDALCDRLAQDFAQVPEAQGMAAIEAATSAVRREMKAEAAAAKKQAAKKPLKNALEKAPKNVQTSAQASAPVKARKRGKSAQRVG